MGRVGDRGGEVDGGERGNRRLVGGGGSGSGSVSGSGMKGGVGVRSDGKYSRRAIRGGSSGSDSVGGWRAGEGSSGRWGW